jgi:hypothetical protein
MATDTVMLAAIDAAIIDILENGQEVTLKGTVYSKANLDTLRKMRGEYSAAVIRTSTGFFGNSKIIIPRRMP